MKKIIILPIAIFLLILTVNGQSRWHPFAGVNISANSDLYYVGPSFSAGVIHAIGKNKKWTWAPEVQYFRNYSTYGESSTSHSWDKFISFSVRSNFNYKFGKNPAKGAFLGGGFGFQKAKDECVTVTQNGLIKEENVHYDAIKYGAVMLTFNAGYIFPLKKNKSIQTVISIIGPQTAKDYLGTYVEVVSLMNVGVRVVL